MLIVPFTLFGLFAWNTGRQQRIYVTDSIASISSALAKQLSVETVDPLMQKEYAKIEELLIQYANFPNITELSVENAAGRPVSQVVVVNGKTSVVYDYANYQSNSDLKSSSESRIMANNDKLSVLQPVSIGQKNIGFVRLDVRAGF